MLGPGPVAGRLIAALLVVPSLLDAQEPASPTWAWRLDAPLRYERRPVRDASASGSPEVGPLTHPATPMLLSLGLPGAGQHLLGQRRRWVYLGLEVLGWSFYVQRRGAGADFRDQYRDFAWNQARIQSGPRIDADFAYYETLTNWTRSGAFDREPITSGLQPELDPSTFNGSIWDLAARIFLPGGTGVAEDDPSYQRALEYYSERAYATGFLWDWSAKGGAQQEFSRLITESDDRFRGATNALGAVLANHVLSSVDAYLSARGLSPPVEARIAPGRASTGPRWFGGLSIPMPR